VYLITGYIDKGPIKDALFFSSSTLPYNCLCMLVKLATHLFF